jgi:deoxyribodipyrimidine photo-lyase
MSVAFAASRTVVWFRNDLRIHDNPVLTAASAQFLRSGHETVCVYCFDPRHYEVTPFGSLKTGAFRAQFLLESVANLRRNLKLLGQDLFVAYGKPESCIPYLLKGSEACKVFVQGEVTSEEIAVEKEVEERLLSMGGSLMRINGGSTLYHPEDLPFASHLQVGQVTFFMIELKFYII